MKFLPTEDEQKEYLEYRTETDFYNNLESGINKLQELLWTKDNRKIILIAGAMVAFDKGTIHFLNELANKNKDCRYVLFSEVTAEFRRKTKECIEFEYICTPHLLAKEIIVPHMNINVSDKMIKYVNKRKYLIEAVRNLEARHRNIGRNYALTLMYYADLYLKKLLRIVKPQEVILWNEFYAFHSVFKKICKLHNVKVQYMEFGCIPGTIVIESRGQQGESFIARTPYLFNCLPISKDEVQHAEKVVTFIKKTNLNRNVQPLGKKIDDLLVIKKNGLPIVTYMGQNDYESGMYPYTRKTKKYHSPIFKSTLQGLEFLRLLAIKNEWNLVYKPHPIINNLDSEKKELEKIDCVKVADVDVHELIDLSDVVVTILSQTAYVSLFRDTPVVLLGYMQLKGSKTVYEAYNIRHVEYSIKKALKNGMTLRQRSAFYKHIARELKYYLYDDLTERKIRYGKELQ